jgi:signal transduction histidine kinase/CheY-like chemotaxis protein
MTALLAGSILIIGYLYGIPFFYNGPFIPPALPTSICFFLLNIGIFCLVAPLAPLFKSFLNNSVFGHLIRSLLPSILVMVLFEGWANSHGLRFSANSVMNDAIFSISLGLVIALIVFYQSQKISSQIETASARRKGSEEKLRESEYFFKESQRAAFIGSYKFDIVNCSWESSEVLDALFGIDESFPKTTQGWIDIVHVDDREMMDRYLKEEVIAKRNPFAKEYRITRKNDGETRWVNGLGALSFDNHGNIASMFGTVQDISERKKTESLLLNSQKLEALGVLSGGIAHDFNNLLGGIFGYIDLAREKAKTEDVTLNLSKAMNTIERARGLTRQLLTFAKGGAPIIKTGCLFPFVQETVQFALSGSSVLCRFSVPDNLRPCSFDRDQIGQVIDNIIINAQQAMPGGGVIKVSARNSSFSEKEHSVLSAGEYVKLSFADSGIGISKDVLPSIFDPFYTTKAKGHGLGLATCYSIVNRHGGCIDVESEPGKGSTFHVYLPTSSEPMASLWKKPSAAHEGKGTALIMDDEEVMRDTISEMLKSLGYAVLCKANGRDAIDYFLSETKANRTISWMMFDLTVPGGMGGKEAVAELRKLNLKTPVFVVSGYADDPVMANPADYGFTASICKPFRRSELAEMLNKYLTHKVDKVL